MHCYCDYDWEYTWEHEERWFSPSIGTRCGECRMPFQTGDIAYRIKSDQVESVDLSDRFFEQWEKAFRNREHYKELLEYVDYHDSVVYTSFTIQCIYCKTMCDQIKLCCGCWPPLDGLAELLQEEGGGLIVRGDSIDQGDGVTESNPFPHHIRGIWRMWAREFITRMDFKARKFHNHPPPRMIFRKGEKMIIRNKNDLAYLTVVYTISKAVPIYLAFAFNEFGEGCASGEGQTVIGAVQATNIIPVKIVMRDDIKVLNNEN